MRFRRKKVKIFGDFEMKSYFYEEKKKSHDMMREKSLYVERLFMLAKGSCLVTLFWVSRAFTLWILAA